MDTVQELQYTQMTLPAGSVVRNVNGDRYIIEELLGKGGSSAVYLVHERREKKDRFALKEVIDPDRLARERFAFEAEVLMRLDHDALPHVYKVFENERLKRIYFLMDYIEGKDLETLRKEQPDERFLLPVVLALLSPIVEALNYLHNQNPPIVHRDIKPGNIVVPMQGDNAMLVDFGIAKEQTNDGTTTIIRRGTPGYAALEQYGGGTNIRTDVYGFAATLYTLLTGIVPVDALMRAGGSSSDSLQPAHELIPALPLGVSKAISRGMSINRDHRFASIDEFWTEVQTQAKQGRTVAVHDDETDTTHASNIVESTAFVRVTGENDATDKLLSTRHQRVKKDIAPMTLEQQREIAQKERRRNTLLAVLGVFCLLLALSAGIIPFVMHMPHPVTAVGRPLTAHLSPLATPTVDQSPYPTLVPSYRGAMHDYLNDYVVASYLTRIQQKGENFSGFCNCLGLTGPFTGKVGIDGSITFTTKMVGRETQMLFQGHIKTGGDMAGQFYIIDSAGQHTGEYGDWSFKKR